MLGTGTTFWLVFGIDFIFVVVLFYRGLEFTESREMEFDIKEDCK